MPQENRSTLFTVFSGWKFYTKERSLLKKYLFECGESIGDMSMLTTLEVNNSANKRSRGNGSFEHPMDNTSFSIEKSLMFNYRDNFFTNPSLDYKQKKVSGHKFLLNEDRSASSMADRRFHRMQNRSIQSQNSSIEREQEMTPNPMIMHKTTHN
jgi:hypothetical protein